MPAFVKNKKNISLPPPNEASAMSKSEGADGRVFVEFNFIVFFEIKNIFKHKKTVFIYLLFFYFLGGLIFYEIGSRTTFSW